MKNRKKSRGDFRAEVTHLFCWCLVVALNQNEGIGRERLDKLSASVVKWEREIGQVIREKGKRDAVGYARKKLLEAAPGVEADARVPLNRSARNYREEQLLMAGNDAIALAWPIWALGLHDGLSFGALRLNRVRQAALDNFRQFNKWEAEDGEDVAYERLRRCVEATLREETYITEEKPEPQKFCPQCQVAMEDRLAVIAAVAQNERKMAGARAEPASVLSRQEFERRISELTKDTARKCYADT